MLKAILFDMDGVLVDSSRYIQHAFNVVLQDSGVQLSTEQFKKYLGQSLKDKLRLWKQDYGIKDYDVEEFSREAGKIELDLMKKDLQCNYALHAFLKEAKEHGLKLAVATSSLRWRAEKIVEMLGIQHYFSALVTAEDAENHKPAPDLFLEAARQLGVNPAYCVVFEDAVKGIEAARKGGMRCVAVKTEFHSMEELEKADIIITDFSEIDVAKLKKQLYS